MGVSGFERVHLRLYTLPEALFSDCLEPEAWLQNFGEGNPKVIPLKIEALRARKCV